MISKLPWHNWYSHCVLNFYLPKTDNQCRQSRTANASNTFQNQPWWKSGMGSRWANTAPQSCLSSRSAWLVVSNRIPSTAPYGYRERAPRCDDKPLPWHWLRQSIKCLPSVNWHKAMWCLTQAPSSTHQEAYLRHQAAKHRRGCPPVKPNRAQSIWLYKPISAWYDILSQSWRWAILMKPSRLPVLSSDTGKNPELLGLAFETLSAHAKMNASQILQNWLATCKSDLKTLRTLNQPMAWGPPPSQQEIDSIIRWYAARNGGTRSRLKTPTMSSKNQRLIVEARLRSRWVYCQHGGNWWQQPASILIDTQQLKFDFCSLAPTMSTPTPSL